jgi:hypothetical protein
VLSETFFPVVSRGKRANRVLSSRQSRPKPCCVHKKRIKLCEKTVIPLFFFDVYGLTTARVADEKPQMLVDI